MILFYQASSDDFRPQAPPRNQVVKNLKNGIIINLLGMGATLLGLQATVGALVAKALTTSSAPYLQGRATATSPVLALDVFLVQVSIGPALYCELTSSGSVH